MLMLTREAANNLDRYLISNIGISEEVLVEHAAMAVARCCERYLKMKTNAGVPVKTHLFAGKGMNGQDAFACARNLYAKGYQVVVWEVFPSDSTGSGNHQKDLCRNLGITVKAAVDFKPNGQCLIVDGIFGTAFSVLREPSEPVLTLFKKIHRSAEKGSHVIAIDIPSGVEANTGLAAEYTITADETVTFILPKPGLFSYPGRKYAGTLFLDGLGIPSSVLSMAGLDKDLPQMTDLALAAKLLPSRPADGHKGTFGRVGVIGGSAGMAGSICLSTMAVMRSGAGLTYLRVPEAIQTACLEVVPEALISSDYETAVRGMDAVLIGPGMEDSKQSEQFVFQSVREVRKLVLDAQALNILAADPDQAQQCFHIRNRNRFPLAVLTPHPGEFKRLMPEFASLCRIDAARAAAKKWGVILVLKGAGTVVAAPDGTIFINSSGNSSMAKGGSGDVLSGILAALAAQTKKPLDAAVLAVYLHGLCGDLSAAQAGEFSAIPGDFIQSLPLAFQIMTGEKEAPFVMPGTVNES